MKLSITSVILLTFFGCVTPEKSEILPFQKISSASLPIFKLEDLKSSYLSSLPLGGYCLGSIYKASIDANGLIQTITPILEDQSYIFTKGKDIFSDSVQIFLQNETKYPDKINRDDVYIDALLDLKKNQYYLRYISSEEIDSFKVQRDNYIAYQRSLSENDENELKNYQRPIIKRASPKYPRFVDHRQISAMSGISFEIDESGAPYNVKETYSAPYVEEIRDENIKTIASTIYDMNDKRNESKGIKNLRIVYDFVNNDRSTDLPSCYYLFHMARRPTEADKKSWRYGYPF